MLIVDVASANQDIYSPPEKIKTNWFWNFQLRWFLNLLLFSIGIMILFPIISISINWHLLSHLESLLLDPFHKGWMRIITYGYGIILILFTASFFYIISKLRLFKKMLKKDYPISYNSGKEIILSRPIGQFIDMINTRIGSTVKLASEIFLKRARSQVYEDAKEHELLGKRSVGILLNALNNYEQNKSNFDGNTPPELHLNLQNESHKKILDLCVDASKMPTTLWFKSDNDKKDKLLAAGGIISCYSLIKHYHNKTKLNKDEKNLMARLLTIWKSIILNPYYLLEFYKLRAI